MNLTNTRVGGEITRKIRKHFVAFAITISAIWFILVTLAWILISFVWNPPQMHSPEVRASYVQIALVLVGGGAAVFAIYAGLLALSEQLGFPELCLHVRYRSRANADENHILFDGDPQLEGPGRPMPGTDVQLALMNYSNVPASQITIAVSSNNSCISKHSEHFLGPEGNLFDIISVNWRAKDGTVMPPKPKEGPNDKSEYRRGRIPPRDLVLTRLDLGTFHLDESEGIFWLEVNAIAKNMPTSASFKLSLDTRPYKPRRQETDPRDGATGVRSLLSYAACRSIQAWTSRSFHRKCLPIL